MLSEDAVLNEAKVFVHGENVYSLQDFKELNSDLIDIFELFIKELKDSVNNIVIFLPPYNPYVYSYFLNSKKYRIVKEVEDYIVDYAGENDIRVIGSYDP